MGGVRDVSRVGGRRYARTLRSHPLIRRRIRRERDGGPAKKSGSRRRRGRFFFYAGGGLFLMLVPMDATFGASEIGAEAMARSAGSIGWIDRGFRSVSVRIILRMIPKRLARLG